jgi:hypothetical protein
MNFKLWIIAFGAFVVVSLAGDYGFTRWAIDENPSSNAGRIYHLIHENGDEIPVFGSSKVYYDYIPAEMGVNAFNYGLDGSSYEVTDAFLQIELAKRKTTPIIIDLKPQGESGIGDPSAFIPFAFDPPIRRLLETSRSMIWRYYVPGIRYFGYYDYYLKEFVNHRAHLMRKVERGFSYEKYWTFDRERLDDAIRQRMRGVNGYFPDPGQDGRLLDRIKQHPERLFFLVYSPVHSSCLTNFKNLDQFNAFKAMLASLPNAVVIDFEQTNYPDQWFKDTNHLLYDGAVDFSRRLGARINDALRARSSATNSKG